MKRLACIVMIWLGFSCEDPVQVKLDEGSTLLVVDAFLNNTSATQTIRLKYSSPYFSNQPNSVPADAKVKIIHVRSGQVYDFKYQSNGAYEFEPTELVGFNAMNDVYTLQIELAGKVYLAETSLSRSAGIDSIGFSKIPPSFSQPTVNGVRYACRLWAKDSTGKTNDYYWIKTLRNDTLFQDVSDLNLSIDGTNGEVPLSEGPPNAFTPPSVFLAFKSYLPKDRCRVEIHSISKNCYLFLLQARNQISNGGLFAQTPENVRTNLVTPKGAVYKAVGWFNIAAISTASIQIP